MVSSFTLKSDVFEGPLDVLLDLIEARKLSISEVSLANVCDGYLAHVESLPELPLKETSQFILIASTLLLIKSRSLLPNLELTQEEKESVDELEKRLARLAVFRKASKHLKGAWGRKPLMLAISTPARQITFAPGEITSSALLQSVKKLVHSLPKNSSLQEAVVAPVRALEEILEDIRSRLSRAARASFRELTARASREERIVYFLAMLELVRAGSASVVQEKLFADIVIEIEKQSGIPRYGF